MTWRTLTLAALTLGAPCYGQAPPPVAAQGALDAARAAAVRPGDALLSCRLLRREMNTLMRDRPMQRYLSEQEVVARGDVFDAFVAARRANEIALIQAQQNHLGDQVDKLHAVAERMKELLPQFMRGERVRNLGHERNCAFAREPRCQRCR